MFYRLNYDPIVGNYTIVMLVVIGYTYWVYLWGIVRAYVTKIEKILFSIKVSALKIYLGDPLWLQVPPIDNF